MSLPENRQRSPPRTVIISIVIIVTIYIILRSWQFTAGIASLFIFLGFGMISAIMIYRYMKSLRGYQDRYTNTGKSMENMTHVMRLGGLFIAFVATFSLLSSVLNDVPLAFLISTLAYVIVVQLADSYAAREMREYVDYKEKRHRDFVESLGDGKGRCMSCRKEMDADEQFCPYCGFEQREIKKDNSYVSK